MRAIIIATKQAVTYSILFVAFLTGLLTIINFNFYQIIGIDLKAFVLITYYLTINSLLIKRAITNRIIWNIMFLGLPAIFLFLVDLSMPTLALKLITHVPLIGGWAEKAGILLKIPESVVWATIAVSYAWIIGLIEFEELPAFERQIILRMEWLKYRL